MTFNTGTQQGGVGLSLPPTPIPSNAARVTQVFAEVIMPSVTLTAARVTQVFAEVIIK